MKNPPDNIPAMHGPKTPLATLSKKFAPIGQLVARCNSSRVVDAVRMVEIRGISDVSRKLALDRIDRLPPLAELEEQLVILHSAVFEPAPERELRAVLGVMLGGIPNAATQATTEYGDALVFSILHVDDSRDPDDFPRYRGLSAAVLFATAQALWLTCKFAPSIAEVIDTARRIRADYWSALAATNRLSTLRADAEDVVAITNPIDAAVVDLDQIPF
jgi:hypothetical protein